MTIPTERADVLRREAALNEALATTADRQGLPQQAATYRDDACRCRRAALDCEVAAVLPAICADLDTTLAACGICYTNDADGREL